MTDEMGGCDLGYIGSARYEFVGEGEGGKGEMQWMRIGQEDIVPYL